MKKAIFFGVLLSVFGVNAQEIYSQDKSKNCPPVRTGEAPSTESLECNGLVEIRYQPKLTLPYSERKQSWSPMFGFSYDSLKLTAYKSKVNGKSYEELYGSGKMTTSQLYGGVQFNLSVLTLNTALGLSVGRIQGSNSGESALIAVDAKHFILGIQLDPFSKEPYVLPYANFEFVFANVLDTVAGESQRPSISPFMAMTFGALIQLNWLDPVATYESLIEHSVNNTFLDLHIKQYSAPSNAENGSLASAMALGLGFKIEL